MSSTAGYRCPVDARGDTASRRAARRTPRPTSGSPYSSVHNRAIRNSGKRIMSSSGTAHHTARHRSGRCVIAAPTSSPPFEPPAIARRSRERSAGGDQPVGGGVEVVEHVLLVRPPAGLVPCLAVLETAAQPGDRVQATGRAPRGDRRRPHRGLGDREPAVAVEDRRGSASGSTSARCTRNSPIGVPSNDGYSTCDTVSSGTRSRSTAGCNAPARRVPFDSSIRHTEVGASNP